MQSTNGLKIGIVFVQFHCFLMCVLRNAGQFMQKYKTRGLSGLDSTGHGFTTCHFTAQVRVTGRALLRCSCFSSCCAVQFAASMPGAPAGCLRPRKTEAQWHAIGVRLMSKKKTETNADIATEFNVNLRTMYRAKTRFNAEKRLHGKPGPKKGHGGAPRYYSADQHEEVDTWVEHRQTEDWDFTALDLKHDLGSPGGGRASWSRTVTLKDGSQELRTYVTPGERSCNRMFERRGFKAYAIQNREDYNDQEREKRVEFAEKYSSLEAADWREMFSTDEHGVYFSRGRVAERQLRGRRLKCRRKKGEGQKAGCTRTKSGASTRGGTRVGLWVAICNGKSEFGEMKALLPSKEYTQFAYAKVVKSISKFVRRATNKHGRARVSGIQDGMKAHWAPAAMRAAVENRVSFLTGFPARSPDLNPIENLFAMLDRYLYRLQKEQGDAANKLAFMARVRSFFALPSTGTLINTLLESMPNRLAKCIEVEGRATGY